MNLIDRYIMKQFIMTLFFSIMALYVIFVVVNMLENLDEFLDQNATFLIMIDYYISFFPGILKLLMPVAMLLSTLFTIGKLSTLNEITAMKSGGLSLYRLMVPLIAFSLALSIGQLYFNGWVVPEANKRKLEIEREFLNKTEGSASIYNLYFRDSPKRNILIQYYSHLTQTANKMVVEEYSSVSEPRLLKRVEADKAVWDSTRNKWKMHDAVIREYNNNILTTSQKDSIFAEVNLQEQQVLQLQKSQDEMTFDELKGYISLMGQGGKDVRRQLIDYYGQYAFPFANFIVVFFGVPFASIKKKGGIAIQIGAAMVISFFYMIFTKLSQTVGYSTDISPVLTGWIANIIFAFFGIIVLFRTKT